MAKTIIYEINADNLLDNGHGGLLHYNEIRVNDTDYEGACRRIMEIVSRVFPTGMHVRYIVYVMSLDESLPLGSQYSVVDSMEFDKNPLPSTLEEFEKCRSLVLAL